MTIFRSRGFGVSLETPHLLYDCKINEKLELRVVSSYKKVFRAVANIHSLYDCTAPPQYIYTF